MDVRVLSLKRWNLPQNQSLYEYAQPGNAKLGDYVSFQNYHFIDVRKVEANAGSSLFTAAHNIISSSRGESAGSEDVYLQQSIVLVGESGQFWDTKPKALYVTMMQLTDLAQVDLSTLEKKIRTVFEKRGIPKERWCFYYTFDFCDLVIFSKDLWPDKLHDVLWDLCPFGGADGWVQDTITTYSVEFDFLMEHFRSFASKRRPKSKAPKGETLACSLSMGVQSGMRKNTLISSLNRFAPETFRSTGRYDVNMYFKQITSEQFLYILYCIDRAFSAPRGGGSLDKRLPDYGGYELVLLSKSDESGPTVVLPQRGKTSQEFKKAGKRALNCLFDAYASKLKSAGQGQWGYAAEIKRSLLTLLQSDFSEEFVLSAFNSFAAYLSLVAANIENTEQEDLFRFQLEYFQALSMFAHSTMHSEKQFIQAPAFNAILSDVPPKLLAFYTSIASDVVKLLNDEENNSYSFFFVPDFRPDIFVRPISPASWTGGKIATISVNEEMAYNPTAVINTMCHEIAHHVGCNSRKREERGKRIFRTLGTYLVYETFFESKSFRGTERLLTSFSAALGSELCSFYVDYESRPETERDLWFAYQIEDYLSSQSFLMKQMDDDFFLQLLRDSFFEVLKTARPKEVETFARMACREIEPLYIVRLCGDENKTVQEIGKRQLADIVVRDIQEMIHGWRAESIAGKNPTLSQRAEDWVQFCINLPECYKEAYSDMRMVQLLGIDSARAYRKILSENISGGSGTFQYRMRQDAVCALLEGRLPKAAGGKPSFLSVIEQIAAKELSEYLTSCQEFQPDKKRLQKLRALRKNLDTKSAQMLFETVSEAIVSYRKRLCEFANEVTSA